MPLKSNSFKNTSIYQRVLAMLRIYLGVILLITDFGKLTGDQPFSVEMLGFLNVVIARAASPFYVHFLQSVIIPHAKLVSYLVMTGELIAGIGLLTGTFTRVSAGIAILLFINFMFAKGAWPWSPNSQDAAVIFIALAVLIARAGRVAGVDYLLAKKWPSGWFW